MPPALPRRALTALLAAGLVLPLACSRGPGAEQLRGQLQRSLDESFEKGVFQVRSLRRMGSAPFRAEDDERPGLFVYYDAELELLRDYSLTAWRGLNLGTLAFALGATELGVLGFKPGGNAAGDVLHVSGRLSYHREDAGWVHAPARLPAVEEPMPAAQELRGSGPDAALRGVRELLGRSPETRRGSKDAVIVSELRRAVSRIDLGIARLDGRLTFGSGPSGGTYHSFGLALAEFATRRGTPVYSYASEGSMENGSRLQAGSLDFALVQSDVAGLLYEGWPEEGLFPNRDLRSVASLWPEAVHLVTLARAGIETIGDLRGRRVAIGRRGSGTRYNAVQIAIAAGMEAGEVPEILEVGLREGIAALEAGSLDALFVTEAVPSPALQAFASGREDVRFLSLETEVVDRLSGAHFAYYPLTVEARTYPGQPEPFRTLGLACALMTTRHAPDPTVEDLLDLLVSGADELSERYYRAAFISRETMRLGIAVPLHPAAERFYARLEEGEGGAAEGAADADAERATAAP